MNKKAILLTILILCMTLLPSFAVEEEFIAYPSDIKAMINGSYIGSYIIDDKLYVSMESIVNYGYELKWVADMNQYYISYTGHHKSNMEAIEQVGQLYYQGSENIDPISHTYPQTNIVATPHSRITIVNPAKVEDAITITFSKTMKSDSINASTVRIYKEGDIDVSEHFAYVYDNKANVLTIEPNRQALYLHKSEYRSYYESGRVYEHDFKIVLTDGVQYADGQSIVKPLIYQIELLYDGFDDDRGESKVAKATTISANHYYHGLIYAIDGVHYINVDALGVSSWSQEDRTLYLTSHEAVGIEAIGREISQANQSLWIEALPESMVWERKGKLSYAPSDDENEVQLTLALDHRYVEEGYVSLLDYKDSEAIRSSVDASQNDALSVKVIDGKTVITVKNRKNSEGSMLSYLILSKGLKSLNGDCLDETLYIPIIRQ